MRTTLSLDDDVAHLVEEAMHRRASMKQVVNDALRAALSSASQSDYVFPDLDLRLRPGFGSVDPNQLVDEMEEDAAIESVAQPAG